jgi:O-antigen/teichoic acid export membrane protein
MQLLRNLVSLSTGEVATRLIGFATFAVLARRLEPSEYGSVELAVALALFFAMLVDFGLGTIGTRTIARDRQQVDRLSAQIPAARLLMAVIAIPAMGGVAMAAGLPQATINLVWLFSVGLLAVPWFQRWLFQGLEMMKLVSIGPVVRASVFCLGVVIFVQEPGDLLAVGKVEIAAAAFATLYYVTAQKLRVAPVRVNFQPGALRELFHESASVGLSQIVWAANQYTPAFLVGSLVGGEVMSWFGASQRIAMALRSFSAVYHTNLFPSVSRKLVESLPTFNSLVRASYRTIAWLGILVALAATLFAELLCRTVFGDSFGPAAQPLKVLVWTVPVTLLSGHCRAALVAGGEQKYLLYAQLGGLSITLLVGFATIPTYGAVAGAATMLISAVSVWMIAHAFAARRVAAIPLLGVFRPLLVAAVLYAMHFRFAPESQLAGLAVLAGYVVFGPLLDRSFVADARQLWETRQRQSGPPTIS